MVPQWTCCGHIVCVECLFFKDTKPSPLQDSFSIRQKSCLPGHPPAVTHPESIAGSIARVGSGPNCFKALVSSPGLLQSPIL